MNQFDYAIIGAGLIGSAAAKYVSQNVSENARVCLIGPANPTPSERTSGSSRLAFGADNDEGRIAQSDCIADPVSAELARKSIARFGQIAADSGVDFFHEVGALTILGSAQQSTATQSHIEQVLSTSCGRATVVHDLHQNFPFLGRLPSCCGLYSRTNAGHLNPRKLVSAQITLARKAGCQLIRDSVVRVLDHGDRYVLRLQSGDTVEASRVLVACGSCSVWPGLLPGVQIDADPQTQTVLLVEVTEEAARHSLAGMPSMWVRDFWQGSGGVNSKQTPGLGYCLPPIRHLDGRWYMKIGHGKLHDKPIGADPESIAAWYRGGGSFAVGQHLFDVFKLLFPTVLPLSLRLDACASLSTPTGQPYVDALPGVRRRGTLCVAAGGNGSAAKSSDELGRLAADLLVTGRWTSDVARSRFTVRLKERADPVEPRLQQAKARL